MALASFKIGAKELFIPDVNIALLRSPGLPANNAKFHVPLWFSKLDLRDYLFHAYNVEILSVRSYVKQSRVQSGRPGLIRPAVRRWHRPRANKYMTVELARPFVWPEEPEDGYKEWNRKELAASDKEQEAFQENLGSQKDTIVNEERRVRMREQAKALLEGKAMWKAPEGVPKQEFRRGHLGVSARRSYSTSARDTAPLGTSLKHVQGIATYDGDYHFHYQNEDEARDDILARKLRALPNDDPDDLEECQQNKKLWLLRIMNAVASTCPRPPPPNVDVDFAQWTSLDGAMVNRVHAFISSPSAPHEIERRAWLLLEEVWRTQRYGVRTYAGMTTKPGGRQTSHAQRPPPMKCSDRLSVIVQLIQETPSLAKDVLTGESIIPLVATPLLHHHCKTKALHNARIRSWRKRIASESRSSP